MYKDFEKNNAPKTYHIPLIIDKVRLICQGNASDALTSCI